VRLALKVVMKMTVILWLYSSYIAIRHLYLSIQVSIIEDLVHVSFGEPLLLTEVAVRTS